MRRSWYRRYLPGWIVTGGGGGGLATVTTDATLTGAGTVASPLGVAGWPLLAWPLGQKSDAGEATVANKLNIGAFTFPAPVSCGHIRVQIGTADGANNSDVGIYNAAGTLLGNAGAQHMGSTGLQTFAFVQGTILIPAGTVYAVVTSAAATIQFVYDETNFMAGYTFNTQSSSGGACPATITPPAISVSTQGLRGFLF